MLIAFESYLNKTTITNASGTFTVDYNFYDIINTLLLSSGSTYTGQSNSSDNIIPNHNKLPIYLPIFDDCFIPLAGIKHNNSSEWFTYNSYFGCVTIDGVNYLRYYDDVYIPVNCSINIIKAQYKKANIYMQKIYNMKNKLKVDLDFSTKSFFLDIMEPK